MESTMQNDNQQGQNQSGSQSKILSKNELEQVIRGGKWGSQQEANQYLQRHGYSCQISDDGTADIFQGQQQGQKVASVKFQGTGQNQRSISSIDF
jgi:hypothetical protein